MQLAAIGLLVGVVAGIVAGGRPSVERLRAIRHPWLLAAAAVAYALAWLWTDLAGEPTLVALAVGAVLVWTVANGWIVGAPVLALGLGLNLVPLALDGATPVDPAAVVTADGTEPGDVAGADLGVGRRLERDEDRFVFLGDVIPVEWTGWVISFGDLIAGAGVANMAFRLLRPPAPRRRDEELQPVAVGADPSVGGEDPWTAMLRGDISEDTYRRATGEHRFGFSDDTPSGSRRQEPLPTGPIVVTGSSDASDDDVDLTVLSWKAADADPPAAPTPAPPVSDAPPEPPAGNGGDAPPVSDAPPEAPAGNGGGGGFAPPGPPATDDGPAAGDEQAAVPAPPPPAADASAVPDPVTPPAPVEEAAPRAADTGPIEVGELDRLLADATPAPPAARSTPPPGPPQPDDRPAKVPADEPAPVRSEFERALARFDQQRTGRRGRAEAKPIFDTSHDG